MAKAGKKYPLVIYTVMINRWWPAVTALGAAVLGLAWIMQRQGAESWRWTTLAGIGGLILLVGLAMLTLRKFAYVQLFPGYLRLVTPFLRLNISYKRVRKTTSANFGSLFPPSSVSNWKREIVEPIASMTAIVVELNAYPISRTALLLFLSPFFFKDTTPHFVILTNDWMKFSSELESMRTGGSDVTASQIKRKETSSILSKLPRNK
jgi:hypothetical protein